MTTAQHRKAFVAFGGTVVCCYVAAWAQNHGTPPGWLMAGVCVLLGVVVGLTVLGTREARPVPEAVRRLRALPEARRASRP